MLKAIMAFLNRRRQRAYRPEAAWESEDTRALGSFLRTDTGRKFAHTLGNMSLRQNATAVLSGDRLEYNCGYACGFHGCVVTIESLADFDQSE